MRKFIARQPILNRDKNLFGYELLFRSSVEDYFQVSGDVASSRVVVDSFLLFGIESLTAGRPAFINFTRNLITGMAATLLPPYRVFIEVLETVDPDPELVTACRTLKKSGYTIVLDDFTPHPALAPLVEAADILKVDFLNTPLDDQARLVKEYAPRGKRLLAEKIETHDTFRAAFGMGYTYFQGFFFSKPETLSRTDVPLLKHNHLQLLSLASQPDPDFAALENLIRRDPSVCYRFLRYLNSAWFGFRSEITSIRHALSLLGVDEVRKWLSLVALAALAEDRPQPVVIQCIFRARFHELLAPQAGLANHTTDLFLQGLFSCMDAVLDRPLWSVLNDVPLAEDIKMALLGQESPFRNVLDVVTACEKADWLAASNLANSLRVQEADLAEDYISAVQWSQELLHLAPVTV